MHSQQAHHNSKPRPSAFALMASLLILSAVTLLAVALFSTAQSEMRTARSYAGVYRADLAVQSGLEAASEKIKAALGQPSIGGVAYTNWGYFAGGPSSDAYYLGVTLGFPDNVLPDADYNAASHANFMANNTVWLFSGQDPDSPSNTLTYNALTHDPLATPSSAPSVMATDNVDLGAGNRFPGLPTGTVVPWVNYSVDIDRATGTRYVYRYAYWVDDESSRINLSTAGSNASPPVRDWGFDGSEIDGSEIPPLDLPGAEIASGHYALLTPPTARQFLTTPASYTNELEFHTTVYARGENRIAHAPAFNTDPESDTSHPLRGKRKMNLNWAGHINTDPIADRVENLADWIEYGAPAWFQKGAVNYFPFQTTSPKPDEPPYPYLSEYSPEIRRTQIDCLAAAIIDYRDADHIPAQPSLTDPDPGNLGTSPPVYIVRDIPVPEFFGTDRAPLINEVALIWNCRGAADNYVKAEAIDVSPQGGLFLHKIPITWRYELWNQSDQDITEQSYKIRVYNSKQITGSAFGFGADPIPPDTEMIHDLGVLTFTPGELKIVEVNETYKSTGSTKVDTYSSLTSVNEPKQKVTGSFLLYNNSEDKEWLSHTLYVQQGNTNDGANTSGPGNKGDSDGGKINDPRAQVMRLFLDEPEAPTTVKEYLDHDRDWASNKPGKIGYVNNNTGSKNFDYQNFDYWADRPQYKGATADHLLQEPISHIANDFFRSPGELGNIYDPGWSHPRGSGGNRTGNFPYHSGNDSPFRGGGSLHVGSSKGEPEYAANSWNLLDLFDIGSPSAQFVSPKWTGRVNLNIPKQLPAGSSSPTTTEYVLRLPDGLDYVPPSSNGEDLVAGNIVDEIRERLTKDPNANGGFANSAIANWTQARPLMSVGEFSELESLNDPTTFDPPETIEATDTMDRVNRSDRAREEIFARSANLLTTKSSSFRVYVVGEYCILPPNATSIDQLRVISSSATETSIYIDKTFNEDTGELIGNVSSETLYRINR